MSLTEEALIDILVKPKNALTKAIYAVYSNMKMSSLQFTEDALKEVAALAIKRKTGARGLRGDLRTVDARHHVRNSF